MAPQNRRRGHGWLSALGVIRVICGSYHRVGLRGVTPRRNPRQWRGMRDRHQNRLDVGPTWLSRGRCVIGKIPFSLIGS